MRHRKHCIVIILTSLIILSGCKTVKKVIPGKESELKAKQEYLTSLNNNEFRFETLTAKLNIDLEMPEKSVSSRVDMKMLKDSVFQLSVQPFLGIEVFRMEFSRDSIKMMDRMNKRYVSESYAGLKGETPVDFNFYNLQALFTNKIFVPGKQAVLPEDFTLFLFKENAGIAEIQINGTADLQYTFKANQEDKLVSTVIANASGKQSLQWDYNDFQKINSQSFPMDMKALVVSNGIEKGSLKLQFSKIETDVPVRMDFTIPAKYTRITYAQIVKALSNLNK